MRLMRVGSKQQSLRCSQTKDARNRLENKDIKIETPVIFLLNGGEETYMNAAHGFMIEHEWAQEVSHFINIESTVTPYGCPYSCKKSWKLMSLRTIW